MHFQSYQVFSGNNVMLSDFFLSIAFCIIVFPVLFLLNESVIENERFQPTSILCGVFDIFSGPYEFFFSSHVLLIDSICLNPLCQGLRIL